MKIPRPRRLPFRPFPIKIHALRLDAREVAAAIRGKPVERDEDDAA